MDPGLLNRSPLRADDHLQTILDHTHVQIAYLDLQFNFVYVNTAYARGSGYTRQQLLGRNHFELFPHAENEQIFARVRDTGEGVAFVARPFVFPERPELGTTYWDWTLVPVKDDSGAVQGVLLSLVDVTERERMRQARDHLATIVETTSDMISWATPDGKVLYFNRAARRILGLDDDVPATDFEISMVHPDWASRIVYEQGIPAAIQTGVWQGETAVKHHDGRELPVSQVIVAHKSPDGSVEHLSTIIRDITGIKAAEKERERLLAELQLYADELEELVSQRTAELASSEARFHSIFDEAPYGILLCDADGQVLMSNPAVKRKSGYDSEELRGLNLSRLLHSPDPSAGTEFWRSPASSSDRHYHTEQRLVHKDGHIVPTSCTASLMQGSGVEGAPLLLVTVEDITERKQAEAALVQAEKLAVVGRLSASLTHELNNPLQSVMGCLGLAAEALVAGRPVDRYIDVARRELRRAADIVSGLRDTLPRSSGQNKAPIDVARLLGHVLMLVEKKSADRGITICREIAPKLPAAMAVRDQLVQVLLNITLNAIDAMPGGGLLRLEAQATTDPIGVTILIADTGVGMSQETLSHLFEPFYTTKTDGVGLGLWVSQSIIQDHGGRIEVVSGEGEGTSIRIWLPGVQV